jgi:hypothetical protein
VAFSSRSEVFAERTSLTGQLAAARLSAVGKPNHRRPPQSKCLLCAPRTCLQTRPWLSGIHLPIRGTGTTDGSWDPAAQARRGELLNSDQKLAARGKESSVYSTLSPGIECSIDRSLCGHRPRRCRPSRGPGKRTTDGDAMRTAPHSFRIPISPKGSNRPRLWQNSSPRTSEARRSCARFRQCGSPNP